MNNITSDGKRDLHLLRKVPEELAGDHHYLRQGDIIFCSTNSPKLVGKSALFNIDGVYSFSNHLTRLRPDLRVVNARFLQLYLWFLWKNGEFEEQCKHWVNQSTLPIDRLLSTTMCIPPIFEQHRIAAKLEELLTKVDRCKQRLERIPAILKRFRNAVLSAAAAGQLTSSLRKSDDVTTRSWQQVKLGNAADLIQIGPFGSLLHKSEYVKDQIPLVNPTNIVAGRIIPSPDTTISPAKKRQLRRYALQEGDVVIGRRGEMGRCAVVTKKEDGWVCGTGSLFIRPHAKLLPCFLHIFFSSPAAIAYLEESNVGSTMANLNQGIFHQMEVPLPDVEEQQEIVHRVEALYRIADQIEARYKKAKAVVDKLTQSILAKAFRGELVPQDPNDEPASELLNRIREEQAWRQETTGNGQNNRAGNRGRRKGKV